MGCARCLGRAGTPVPARWIPSSPARRAPAAGALPNPLAARGSIIHQPGRPARGGLLPSGLLAELTRPYWDGRCGPAAAWHPFVLIVPAARLSVVLPKGHRRQGRSPSAPAGAAPGTRRGSSPRNPPRVMAGLAGAQLDTSLAEGTQGGPGKGLVRVPRGLGGSRALARRAPEV